MAPFSNFLLKRQITMALSFHKKIKISSKNHEILYFFTLFFNILTKISQIFRYFALIFRLKQSFPGNSVLSLSVRHKPFSVQKKRTADVLKEVHPQTS